MSVSEGLGSWSDNSICDGDWLEALEADAWVCAECFVDGAAPIGKVVVG